MWELKQKTYFCSKCGYPHDLPIMTSEGESTLSKRCENCGYHIRLIVSGRYEEESIKEQ